MFSTFLYMHSIDVMCKIKPINLWMELKAQLKVLQPEP